MYRDTVLRPVFGLGDVLIIEICWLRVRQLQNNGEQQLGPPSVKAVLPHNSESRGAQLGVVPKSERCFRCLQNNNKK